MFSNRYTIVVTLLACLMMLSSCRLQKAFNDSSNTDFLTHHLDTVKVLRDGFSGLKVTDLSNGKDIFSYHEDKRFIPASNIKLLTMAYALANLGDSIVSFRYSVTDTTLILWPCADPTFLHPFFKDNRVIDHVKLLAIGRRVMISYAHVDLLPLGYGWSWDDYQDHYQTEITPMPMYGNVLTVSNDSIIMQVPYTSLFNPSINKALKAVKITRSAYQNVFYFPETIDLGFRQEIPYFNALDINYNLLQDTLNTPIAKNPSPLPPTAHTLYSWPIDTIIRRMMQVSDNMIAEHLLLATGMKLLDSLNTKLALKNAKSTLLYKYSNLDYKWVDGSGLSRQNILKPKVIVALLAELYKLYPEDRLFSMLAVGGQPGSFLDLYNDEPSPYFYGKSGSMSGVYNQCGYLKTKEGKTLAISFMNNNMSSSSSAIKSEVEKIIKWFRHNY